MHAKVSVFLLCFVLFFLPTCFPCQEVLLLAANASLPPGILDVLSKTTYMHTRSRKKTTRRRNRPHHFCLLMSPPCPAPASLLPSPPGCEIKLCSWLETKQQLSLDEREKSLSRLVGRNNQRCFSFNLRSDLLTLNGILYIVTLYHFHNSPSG